MGNQNKSEDGKITLHSDIMKRFLGKTLQYWTQAAQKNKCGDTWMKCYLETLSKGVSTVETAKCSTLFKFGNRERVKSKKFMKISWNIAGKKIFIKTDAVYVSY